MNVSLSFFCQISLPHSSSSHSLAEHVPHLFASLPHLFLSKLLSTSLRLP